MGGRRSTENSVMCLYKRWSVMQKGTSALRVAKFPARVRRKNVHVTGEGLALNQRLHGHRPSRIKCENRVPRKRRVIGA